MGKKWRVSEGVKKNNLLERVKVNKLRVGELKSINVEDGVRYPVRVRQDEFWGGMKSIQ